MGVDMCHCSLPLVAYLCVVLCVVLMCLVGCESHGFGSSFCIVLVQFVCTWLCSLVGFGGAWR